MKDIIRAMVLLIACIACIAIGAVIIFEATDQPNYAVVWKDFGTVENLHDVPAWTNSGAMYYQNMTIMTFHHGNIQFYTGPGGNMCEPAGVTVLGVGSCSTGTVAWINGTAVFIEKLRNGGIFAGAISR